MGWQRLSSTASSPDPVLFASCAEGWSAVRSNLDEIVRRAIGVKASVIQADPYEQGLRASLNLGHTLGHGLEYASGYRLRHGEAVSIGIVAAARLAARKRIASPELCIEIQQVLHGLGLPTEIPAELDRSTIEAAMGLDKKRATGRIRFVLPVSIGEVRTGVEIEDIRQVFEDLINMRVKHFPPNWVSPKIFVRRSDDESNSGSEWCKPEHAWRARARCVRELDPGRD